RGVYRIFGLPAGDFVIVTTTPNNFVDMRLMTAADLQYAQQQLQRQSAPAAAANAPPPQPPPRQRSVTYASGFYPGTTDISSASPVAVNGDERSGIDFSLPLVPTASVSGTVLGPDGRPASAQLTLMTQLLTSGSTGTGKATDRNGNFTFTGIPPGVHHIVV